MLFISFDILILISDVMFSTPDIMGRYCLDLLLSIQSCLHLELLLANSLGFHHLCQLVWSCLAVALEVLHPTW